MNCRSLLFFITKVNAAISFQGAQILSWQPNGENPCIWLSKKSLFQKNIAIRGGIPPICWPWFGLVAQPSHGFARLQEEWQLTTHRAYRLCTPYTDTF